MADDERRQVPDRLHLILIELLDVDQDQQPVLKLKHQLKAEGGVEPERFHQAHVLANRPGVLDQPRQHRDHRLDYVLPELSAKIRLFCHHLRSPRLARLVLEYHRREGRPAAGPDRGSQIAVTWPQQVPLARGLVVGE